MLTLNRSTCFAQIVLYSHYLCCMGLFQLKRAQPCSGQRELRRMLGKSHAQEKEGRTPLGLPGHLKMVQASSPTCMLFLGQGFSLWCHHSIALCSRLFPSPLPCLIRGFCFLMPLAHTRHQLAAFPTPHDISTCASLLTGSSLLRTVMFLGEGS